MDKAHPIKLPDYRDMNKSQWCNKYMSTIAGIYQMPLPRVKHG